MIRCDMWVKRTVIAIDTRLAEDGGPQGSGKGDASKDLLEGIASHIAKLNW